MSADSKFYTCDDGCGAEVTRFMRFCPNCGAEQMWDSDTIGSDANEADGAVYDEFDYTGWAVSRSFSYSPWDGGEYSDATDEPVSRAKGFRLEFRCYKCEGLVERYMNWCPSCGAGEDGGKLYDRPFIWNRNSHPGRPRLAGSILDTDCEECGWEISSFWTHCPWCGEKRLEFPARIQHAMERLEELIGEEDQPFFKKIRYELLKTDPEEGNYWTTAVALRAFLEYCLEYLADEKGISVDNRKGAKMMHDKIKGELGSKLPDQFTHFALDVLYTGNRGAHSQHSRKRVDEFRITRALESLCLFLEELNELIKSPPYRPQTFL